MNGTVLIITPSMAVAWSGKESCDKDRYTVFYVAWSSVIYITVDMVVTKRYHFEKHLYISLIELYQAYQSFYDQSLKVY